MKTSEIVDFEEQYGGGFIFKKEVIGRQWIEKITYSCDICKKTFIEKTACSSSLYSGYSRFPLVRIDDKIITSEWGYKKNKFHCCLSHSESEIEKYVKNSRAE